MVIPQGFLPATTIDAAFLEAYANNVSAFPTAGNQIAVFENRGTGTAKREHFDPSFHGYHAVVTTFIPR